MKPKRPTFIADDYEFSSAEKDLFSEMEREERTEQEVDAFLGVVFGKLPN